MHHRAPRRKLGVTPFILRLSNLPSPQPTSESDAHLIAQYRDYARSLPLTTETASEAEFFTQARILDAAVREVGVQNLWVSFDDVTAWNDRGIRLLMKRFPSNTITFGSVLPLSPLHATPEPAWWLSRTIQESMTYDTIPCSYNGTGRDVRDVMSLAAEAGRDFVWVRLARTDRAGSVAVSTVREENADALVTAFGWDIAANSRGADDIIVTPMMEPTFEYRVWVVNGQVVTGAGIAPELDPRHNLGSAFDLQNHLRRGDDEIVSSSPGHVEMLVELARTVATTNANGGDLPDSFVLDLAWDGFVPTIIDVNSISGTALYAADPDRIIRALVA